jgi:hypothetical protein
MITKDINSIKKEFSNFKVVDQDDNFLYMRDGEIGKSNVIEARMNRGSLGAFNVRFVVEKKGCRSRIIGGGDSDKSVKKVKAYLKDNKC